MIKNLKTKEEIIYDRPNVPDSSIFVPNLNRDTSYLSVLTSQIKTNHSDIVSIIQFKTNIDCK